MAVNLRMLYEDNERLRHESSRKSPAERLSEKFAESFQRMTERIKGSISVFQRHVSSGGYRTETVREMLESYYGESVYIEDLSFGLITDWLEGRKEGFSTLIFKMDDDRLNKFFGSESGPELSLGKYPKAYERQMLPI